MHARAISCIARRMPQPTPTRRRPYSSCCHDTPTHANLPKWWGSSGHGSLRAKKNRYSCRATVRHLSRTSVNTHAHTHKATKLRSYMHQHARRGNTYLCPAIAPQKSCAVASFLASQSTGKCSIQHRCRAHRAFSAPDDVNVFDVNIVSVSSCLSSERIVPSFDLFLIIDTVFYIVDIFFDIVAIAVVYYC